jgi:uncharacterized membrane protein required for colicin V production
MGSLPAWLNPFDILIAFALLGGAAWGFIRGLVRTALNLIVLYIAAVLAMTFYDDAGKWLGYMFGTSRVVSEAIAFLGILALTSITINFILRRTYKHTELPGLRQVDQLGGMIIGFFLASIWIGFAILALAFMLGATAGQGGGMSGNLIAYFQTSHLIPVFYKFLPVAMVTLRPWMPKGLPPEIFTVRL